MRWWRLQARDPERRLTLSVRSKYTDCPARARSRHDKSAHVRPGTCRGAQSVSVGAWGLGATGHGERYTGDGDQVTCAFQQVLVHTWRDATLSEITELLAQEHRQVRQSGTKCTFKVLAPTLNTSPRAFGARRLQHAQAFCVCRPLARCLWHSHLRRRIGVGGVSECRGQVRVEGFGLHRHRSPASRRHFHPDARPDSISGAGQSTNARHRLPSA